MAPRIGHEYKKVMCVGCGTVLASNWKIRHQESCDDYKKMKRAKKLTKR